jgi:hypothetical protein
MPLMRSILVITACLALFTISPSTAAQTQEPWYGTWSQNLEKSSSDRNPRYKRAITKIESWMDGLKVTYDLVGVRGGVTHMEWTGRFDGKDYPIHGIDYVLTNAYTRLTDRSYEIVIKVDGAVSATARVEISPDGRTLTTVTRGRNAQGSTVETTAVYDRQ